MGFFDKILGKKDNILPVTELDTLKVKKDTDVSPAVETIRDYKKDEDNKYNPAERVNMNRAEIEAQIEEMAKTDKEKANALRKSMGLPEK